MSLFEILSWISFLTLNLSVFLTFFFYILSVIPLTLEEKIGEKSWKLCAIFRIISDILFLILIVSILMWIWFPISVLNWRISDNTLFLIVIAVLIAIPSFYILIRALKDAGKETIETSKDTKMYGGIYEHIRHPQISGSILLFIILCLILNSLFLLIWITSLMILITPIVIYFEEKDLIKRFGEDYLLYKKNTGALIPKFWSKIK
ncbi:MAG: methyltransferase family protein [Candidatus Hermodarchaeota archaeon]